MRGTVGITLRARLAAAIAFLVGGAFVSGEGCSLVVDTNADQCTSNADCARFQGGPCVGGVCARNGDAGSDADSASDASADTGSGGEPCTSTQDCLAIHLSYSICKPSTRTCASIVSPDCGLVLGEYKRDDALILGAIIPLLGPNRSTGIALRDAMRVALNVVANGVPAGAAGTRRPLGIVICNDTDDPARATEHLVTTLEVPAIFSGTTTEVAAAIVTTAHGDAFVISPTAGSSVPALDGAALFARVAARDLVEADAIVAEVAGDLQPAIQTAISSTRIRAAYVHGSDLQGATLAARIRATLRLNGDLATAPSNADSFVDVDYGDPGAPDSPAKAQRINDAIQAATTPSALPDLVILTGHTEGVTSLLHGIESAWPPAADRRPWYLLGDGLQLRELIDEIGISSDLRRRIWLASRGADPILEPVSQGFFIAYRDQSHDGSFAMTFGTEQTYDAVLLAALGIAAGTGPASGATTDAVSGARIAAGIARLLARPTPGAPPRPAVDLDTAGVEAAFGPALTAAPIDVRGASGPLDGVFHDGAGLAQILCVVNNVATGRATLEASGRVYDPKLGALTGALRPECAFAAH